MYDEKTINGESLEQFLRRKVAYSIVRKLGYKNFTDFVYNRSIAQDKYLRSCLDNFSLAHFIAY